MLLFLLQENYAIKRVGILLVLVVQNRFLLCIFMGLEAHLNYVLRKIKLQVILILFFFLWKQHIELFKLFIWGTSKKTIIISCLLCGIFWFFHHPCQILHTKLWASERAVQKSGLPPPVQETYLTGPHFFCVISSKLMRFVFLSALCHTFTCRKIFNPTLLLSITEERKLEEISNRASLFPV